MAELTRIERNDLERICKRTTGHYKRRLKWHAAYAFGGFCLLVVGLIWLKNCRAPTVTQAMYFCGFVGFTHALGYCVTVLLDYKQVRMIHHLREELSEARNKLPMVESNSENVG